MGYITIIDMTFVPQDSNDHEKESEQFAELCEKASICEEPFNGWVGFEDHNCDITEQVVELSKSYPRLIIEMTGNGEESDDKWCRRIQNGRTEDVSVELVYPPFNDILTPQERRAAKWKASRRGNKTSKLYDPRVVKALRLLQSYVHSNKNATAEMQVAAQTAIDILEDVKRKMR